MKHFLLRSSFLLALLILFTAVSWATAPTISSTTPTSYGKNVTATSNITVTFDQAMNNATLTSSNIKVYSSMSGFLTGSVGVVGNTVTYDPTNSFKNGDVVTVTVTTGVQNSGTVNMGSPYIWTFTAASSGEFITKNGTTKSTGTSPNNAILVDVNNDGDLDIVSSTGNGSTVDSLSILSNTAGSFSNPSAIVTGQYPTNVAAGDFDGVNGMDLVVTNYTDNNISVFLNNGSGSFSRTDYAAQAGTVAAVAVDLDGDGDIDIAALNRSGPSVSVFLNNGNGTFASAVNTASGTYNINRMQAIDIDNDHDIDLVVGGAGYGAYVLKNNGDGSMVAGVDLSITGGRHFAFADVDNDGDADLIAAIGGSNKVSIYLNSGSGTFGSATDYTVPNANQVTVVDLGADGDLDILAVDNVNAKVYILKNNSGTFTNSGYFNVGSNPENVTFGDIDGDGHLDFITANRSGNSVTISRGYPLVTTTATSPANNALTMSPSANITATFNVSMNSATMTSSTIFVNGSMTGLHSGVISYDGPSKTMTFNPANDFSRGEVVTLTLTTGIQGSDGTSFSEAKSFSFTVASAGTGPGYFSVQTTASFFSKSESDFLSADVDNDGDVDLIGQYYSEPLTVSINNGGTFATPVPMYSRPDANTAPGDVTYGDMDNDGYGDLVVLQSNSSPFKYAVILKNNGSGTFSRYDSVAMPSEWLYDIDVNDFNNDGKLDIAYAFNNTVTIKYNTPGWSSSTSITATGSGYITSADIDNDGDRDILGYTYNGMNVLSNNGDGTFAAAVAYAGSFDKLGRADLNGDGFVDLFYFGGGAKAFQVRMNNGTGTFGSAVTALLSIQPAKYISGDFDADGDLDLAFCYQNENKLNVAYNNGSGAFNQQALYSAHMPGFAMMDYDNDGDLDIIGKDYNSNVDLKILQNTLPTAPATSASGVSITNDYGSQFKVNWTNGDGTGRIVVMKQGSAVTWTPSDNTTYTANASFGSGSNLGDGSYVVYNGVSTNVTVSNLSVSTTYHVAVYEYNGLSGMEKYKTASPGTGSDMTNSVAGYPFDTTAGNALSFNGGIYTQSRDNITLGSAFSVEMWVKPASIGAMVIMTHGNNYMWLGMDATGKFTGLLYDDNALSNITITGTSTAVANRWYHLTLTGANGAPLKLYVNGVLEATSGNIGTVSTSSDVFWFGGDYNSASFNGHLDEVRLWSDIRTVSEIRENMNKTLSGIPPNLAKYWQLNEVYTDGPYSYSVDLVGENPMKEYDSFVFVASGAPVGSAAINNASVAAADNGPHTIGNATLSMSNAFDNPVDIYVSELTAEPSNYPALFGSSIGGKYFVINLFGTPGTFSTSLTLTYGAGVITTAQHNDPTLLKLYKRESNSSSSWTLVASATTADSVTGQVTWAGITSFSQFVAVSPENAIPPTYTFTKPDGANWTLPEYQDRITDSVWLTREDYGVLFNIKTESSYNSNTSPQGTEWAYGTTANGIEALAFSTFRALRDSMGGDLTNLPNKDVVLHLIADNIYLDVHFNSWSSGGDGGFSYSRSFLPIELKADSASSITLSSATIYGRIFSNSGAATTRVLYGTTSGIYTDSITVPSSPITATDSLVSFSANLTSLNQGTMYYARISAHNGTRYARSNELSFSTDTALAAIATSATSVVATTATLNGSVLSDGLTASAYFLYGNSSGVYPDSVAATPGSINADVQTSISANLSSLTPGILYYYKVAATNSSYYKRSNERTFITMSSQSDNALAFDGSNDYVAVGNESDFDFTTAVTLEAWIKPTSVSGTRGIVTKNVSSNHPYQLRIENGEIVLGFYDGTWYPVTTSGANIQIGVWTHVAGTYDMTTAKVYVNGVLSASQNYTFSIPLNDTQLEIGKTDNSNYFSGTIDEVRVWNTARTQQQIQDNMNTPFTSAQTGLVGYWQFNASTGTVAHNHGSSAGQGTLTNFNFNGTSGWISSEAPLPVELTSFTATSVRLNAELKWKTATELNNHGYEIERTIVSGENAKEKSSASQKNWSKVGFVEGSGNSNAPNEYSFTDKVTKAAKYSYRLKQIDQDGKFAYSQEVEVNIGAVPLLFALEQNYPNPFNPATTIGFTLEHAGLTTLKVYDIVGREVATLVNEALEAGVYHQKQFNSGNLASGVYFARLVSGSKVQVKKLMLMK